MPKAGGRRGGKVSALCLITVGKPKSPYIAEGLTDYAGRLKAYGGCNLIHLKAERAAKGKTPAQLMAAEAGRILAALEPRDVLWALDRTGSNWSSKKWAAELNKVRESGLPRLCLVIGGAEGLDGSVLQRAQAQISLGSPTLAHEMAALVVMEQLYRAHTILAGTPYHR
jgi:23S rRNA (pseudouridine1915-N3)-methyltransferase